MDATTFRANPQAARYAGLFEDPVLGPALRSAIKVMTARDARVRMVDAALRYGLPPLAAVVEDIERTAEFVAVAGRRKKHDPSLLRLKQAIGIVAKLLMAEEGLVPNLKPDGRQDQARLDNLHYPAKWFATARRYRRE